MSGSVRESWHARQIDVFQIVAKTDEIVIITYKKHIFDSVMQPGKTLSALWHWKIYLGKVRAVCVAAKLFAHRDRNQAQKSLADNQPLLTSDKESNKPKHTKSQAIIMAV